MNPLFTKKNVPPLPLQNRGAMDDMKLEDMSSKEMTILQTIMMYKKTPRIEDAEKLLDYDDDIEYRRRIRSNSSRNSSNGHRKRNQRIFQISKNKKK